MMERERQVGGGGGGQEGHRGACWHQKGARVVIPLLLRDDRKKQAWEKHGGGWDEREGRGGRRGHVGTKGGHVLPEKEG